MGNVRLNGGPGAVAVGGGENRPSPVGLRTGPHVSVLTYHHLLPPADARALGPNPMIVTTDAFGAQMHYLKSHGYVTLSMAQMAAFVQGKAAVPRRAVLITFDDGYQSVYRYAFPILRALDFKATIFVITGLVPRDDQPFDPRTLSYLSWHQLRIMESSGLVDVEGHTDALHSMVGGRPAALAASPDEVRSDLIRSRQKIAAAVGEAPLAMAYPFGGYDAAVASAAKQAGFALAFSGGQYRPVFPYDAPYALARYGVFAGRSLAAFAAMAAGDYGATRRGRTLTTRPAPRPSGSAVRTGR